MSRLRSVTTEQAPPAPSLGLVAAYRWEVYFLLKGRSSMPFGDGTYLLRLKDSYAVLAISGPGAQNAFAAAGLLAKRYPLSGLFSIGFAGALDDSLHLGDIFAASLVVDSQAAEKFPCRGRLMDIPAAYQGILVSSPGVVGSVREKRRLRSTFQGVAVDMESAGVARAAASYKIAFGAVKAITDLASQSISIDFPAGQSEHEWLSTARVVRNGLRSWQGMKDLWSLGAGARLAAGNLAHALLPAETPGRASALSPKISFARPKSSARRRD
jgi:nucleoside phosphorylase